MRYTHSPLGQEIRAAAGHYIIEKEEKLSFQGREVLFATGYMDVNSSCCGTGGCGFALVAGYILNWKRAVNEKGEPVSEVEPIKGVQAKEAVEKLVRKTNNVQQVNFW